VSVPRYDLGFQGHMSWSLFVFNYMRREVVVSFVDIGGIVDHLFKISFRNVLYRIQCKSQQLTEK
jgi:hypothetical protein